MSILEQLQVSTRGLAKIYKPFESWEGSPVRGYEFSIKMLNIGDLADIAKLTTSANPLESSYLSKIYLLAKSIVSIQNQPIVTDEDIEQYNKEHNLSGTQKIDLFGYKVLFFRKCTEAVINRLAYMYDELQDEYLSEHLGRPLPDELKATKFEELSRVGKSSSSDSGAVEESSDDSSVADK